MAFGCAGAKHVTLDGVYHSPLGAIIAVDGKPGRPWYGEPVSVPHRLPTGTESMLGLLSYHACMVDCWHLAAGVETARLAVVPTSAVEVPKTLL